MVSGEPDAGSNGKRTVQAICPQRLTVLHWHGETFDLPAGAARLAQSDVCRNQAFELGGRVLGLQFHLEVLPAGLARLIENSAGDIDSGAFVQSAARCRPWRALRRRCGRSFTAFSTAWPPQRSTMNSD